MERPYKEQATIFCEAIKKLASRDEALQNLELYLSIHFAAWLARYANNPEGIASELKSFSEIEF